MVHDLAVAAEAELERQQPVIDPAVREQVNDAITDRRPLRQQPSPRRRAQRASPGSTCRCPPSPCCACSRLRCGCRSSRAGCRSRFPRCRARCARSRRSGFVDRSRGRQRRAGQPARRSPKTGRDALDRFADANRALLDKALAGWDDESLAALAEQMQRLIGDLRRGGPESADAEQAATLPAAFFLPTGADRFQATHATQGPWDPNAMHGGPPAALVGDAARAPGGRAVAHAAAGPAQPRLPRRPAARRTHRRGDDSAPGKAGGAARSDALGGRPTGPRRPRLVHQRRRSRGRVPRARSPATSRRGRGPAAWPPRRRFRRPSSRNASSAPITSSATGRPTNGASPPAVSTSWARVPPGAARASRSSRASP